MRSQHSEFFLFAVRVPKSHFDLVWRNPWYIVASVAFNAGNEPEAIPIVMRHALQNVEKHEERLLLAHKVREALFKAGLNSGYAKVSYPFSVCKARL